LIADLGFACVDVRECGALRRRRGRLCALLFVDALHRKIGGAMKCIWAEKSISNDSRTAFIDVGDTEAHSVLAGTAVVVAAADVIGTAVLHVVAAAL